VFILSLICDIFLTGKVPFKFAFLKKSYVHHNIHLSDID
jgi:hypothetical protein